MFTTHKTHLKYTWILILTLLSCNLPLSSAITPLSPPTPNPNAPTPAQPAATLQLQPTVTLSGDQPIKTPLPTFTPFLAATVTPLDPSQLTITPPATSTAAATPSITSTPTATLTVEGADELALQYTISWQLDPDNQQTAIASVHLSAQGGGGNYQFLRDEQPLANPNFQYKWASCAANPGSFRVNSANGQSVRIEYYEQTPCPQNP